jgi:hypothetical protein
MMQDFCQATHPNPPNPNKMQGANGQRNGGKTIRHHNKTTDKQNRSKTLSRRLWPVTSVLDIQRHGFIAKNTIKNIHLVISGIEKSQELKSSDALFF